jgi:hypothetical protein
VTVVEASIAIFRGLGEDERGSPARGEVVGVVVFRVGIAAISASLSSAARRPSGMITPSSQGVIQRRNVRGGGMDNAKER